MISKREMISLITFLFVYSIKSELLHWDDVVENNGVYVLTDDNFDKVIYEVDTILVKFYAPWCGHCKKMAEDYINAANDVKSDEFPIYFAEVDATVNKKVSATFEIKGYPTLKLFKKGKPYEYEGERTASAMMAYARKYSSTKYKDAAEYLFYVNDSNLTDYINYKPCALIGVFDKNSLIFSKLTSMVAQAAQELNKKCTIAIADKSDFNENIVKYSVKKTPSYLLFKNGYNIKYMGESTNKYDIVSYLNNMDTDGSLLVESSSLLYEKIRETHKNMESAVIAIFAESNSAQLYDQYVRALQNFRIRLTFFHVYDREHIQKLHNKVQSIISGHKSAILVIHHQHLLSNEEPLANILTGDALNSHEQITMFLGKHSIPLVGFYTTFGKGKPNYDFSQKPVVKIFFECDLNKPYLEDVKYIQSQIYKVAKKNPDVLFAIANEQEHLESDLKKLNLHNTPEDVHVGYFLNATTRFALATSEFNSEILEEFIKDSKKGKLKPQIFSESAKLFKNANNAYHVTANTFNDFLKKSQDQCIILMVHQSECPNCRVVNYFLEEYAKYSDLLIGKIDFSKNDVAEQFEKASESPLIHLFTLKNIQSPHILENDPKSANEIKDFVELHCVDKSMSNHEEL